MRRVARRNLVPIVATAVTVVLAVAGCASGAPPAVVTGVQALAPIPAGIVVHPSVTPLSTSSDDCDAGLRPSGPLPAPGAMPTGSTMQRIQQRGYLIAGVDQDTYLFGYRNPSGDPADPPVVGFDVDFVRAVSQAIFGSPDKVRYQVLTQADRLPALSNHTVDLVADILTVNCARKQQADFSADYFDAGQRILVDQTSTIAGPGDLSGKKVCAAAGTTSIQKLADPAYHAIPVSAVTWADCLVMLQQGQVDAISTTDVVLLGLQVQDPATRIVGPRFTFERHGLGVPKGEDDFVRFLNGLLEQMTADGAWTGIYTQWIGTRLGPVPAPPVPQYQ